MTQDDALARRVLAVWLHNGHDLDAALAKVGAGDSPAFVRETILKYCEQYARKEHRADRAG